MLYFVCLLDVTSPNLSHFSSWTFHVNASGIFPFLNIFISPSSFPLCSLSSLTSGNVANSSGAIPLCFLALARFAAWLNSFIISSEAYRFWSKVNILTEPSPQAVTISLLVECTATAQTVAECRIVWAHLVLFHILTVRSSLADTYLSNEIAPQENTKLLCPFINEISSPSNVQSFNVSSFEALKNPRSSTKANYLMTSLCASFMIVVLLPVDNSQRFTFLSCDPVIIKSKGSTARTATAWECPSNFKSSWVVLISQTRHVPSQLPLRSLVSSI